LSDGIDDILTVLLDREFDDDHHPDNIGEFRYTWFQSPSLGHEQAIMDIWCEHGERCCNNDGIRGDANYDRSVDILDKTYLINFLYLEGPAPICWDEANANGDGTINIFDIT